VRIVAGIVGLTLIAGLLGYFLLRGGPPQPPEEPGRGPAVQRRSPPGPAEGPGAVRFVRGGRARLGAATGAAREIVLPSFYLDLTEVTNADFAAWLAQAHARRDGERVLVDDTLVALRRPGSALEADLRARPGSERLPVVHVTWAGAHAFCRAQHKRLPTEDEWELAARGVFRAHFPWGNDDPRCDSAVWGRAAGQPCAGQGPGPVAVGTVETDQAMSEVRDLAGNVAEWTDSVGSGKTHVVRGGAFDQLADAVRDAPRSLAEEGATRANLGFRCAASAR
jgi:formylglycine-generating enzyme required for sulfatase activity